MSEGGGDRSLQGMHRFFELLHYIIGRNRITLSFIGGTLFVYFAAPTPTAILIGTPFILLGEAIRTWASGFIKKNKELSKEGPYALTRNPLYLGNFFIGSGFSIMSKNLILLALFLIVFTLVYSVTIKNEEKKLSDKFGDIYLAYKGRVPVFFPSLNPPLPPFNKGGMGGLMTDFDWKLVKRHREHYTWLGIAGCLVIFILKLY